MRTSLFRLRLRKSEDGFTMAEIAVTLGILSVIVLSMAVALASGLRYLVTAKQRTQAVQAANALIERARAVARNDWTQLGLVPSDVVAASDSNLSTGTCTGVSTTMFSGEPVVQAGAAASNPLYPHVQTSTIGETTVTLKVYVTGVTPGGCSVTNPTFKRVTVLGTWSRPQRGVSNSVRLATYIFGASGTSSTGTSGGTCCARFEGTASYTNARLVGTHANITGASPPETTVYLSSSTADGRYIGRAISYKGSAVSAIGTLSGGTTTAENKATSIADNDDGTGPGPAIWPSPDCHSDSWTTGLGGLLTSNIVQSANSCSSTQYSDGLPYTNANMSLTNGMNMSSTIPAGGSLSALGINEFFTSSAATSAATVDSVGSGSPVTQNQILSTTSAGLPAMNLLSFSLGTFNASNGAVQIGAGTYSASARAGLSALDPSISGTMAFQIYDPSSTITGCSSRSGSYCVINVDPTSSSFSGYDRTFTVTLSVYALLVETTRITLTTQISVPAPKKSATKTGTTITAASATYSLPKVISTMNVQSPVGISLANITSSADYGQLVAISAYFP